MRLLASLILVSSLLLVTACSNDTVYEEAAASEYFVEVSAHIFPNTVRVLGENSVKMPLTRTELLEVSSILETLELTNHFPGAHLASRSFTEQMVNTLLSLGHTITIEYITDIFIYLHLEYGNYSYLIWWSNNQLVLAGDFVIIRESFLR